MIKTYEAQDLVELLDLWYQASLVAHPFLEEAFLEKERYNIEHVYIPNTKTWVFKKEDKVLGFIGMIDNEVGAIFVHPDQHGQGIGTRLMNWVAERYDSLEVEVFERNKIGRSFYDKYGFTEMRHSIHEETGQPLIRMQYQK